MNMPGNALYFRDHCAIAQQVCNLEFCITGLSGAQQFARPANFQIALRNDKAIIAVTQYLKTRLCASAQGGL